MTAPTIHASAVLFGYRGILIRGPSGAGKSRLALALLQSAGSGFSQLVGDDRIHLGVTHGRLLMHPAGALRGLLEVRGLGIVRLPFEPVAVADLVVDRGVPTPRLPEAADTSTMIDGIRLARLPVAPGEDPLPALLAFLRFPSRGIPPERD